MCPRATWPTASFRMYIGGTVNMPPGSVAASTLITPTWPRATIASCRGPIARSYCRPPAPTSVSTGRCRSMPIAIRPLSGTRSRPSRMPRSPSSSARERRRDPASGRARAPSARSRTRARCTGSGRRRSDSCDQDSRGRRSTCWKVRATAHPLHGQCDLRCSTMPITTIATIRKMISPNMISVV